MILFLIVVGVDFRMGPPTAKDVRVPSNEFSAIRAFNVHSEILKGIAKHPVGTDANSLVRTRITEKFKSLGYEVEHRSGFNCDQYFGGCSTVINIIAIKPGKTDNKAVLLTGHYDSVPAGPGASDDGMGVATIMEVARIVMEDPQYDNDVVFLITDAEEVGLFGAVEFTKNNPLLDQVGVVFSFESRGTDGPSFMFETSENNNELIDIYKASIFRPGANSLFYEIYKRMPNDTDFSIFKRAGAKGLNFANSQAVIRYHSEYDDLAHMGKDTLQHHGDNALSMVRSFANIDLDTIAYSENATYFDLFSAYLVKWSASTGVKLSLLSFVLIMAIVLYLFWSEQKYGSGIKSLVNWAIVKEKAFSGLALVLLIVLTLAFGWLLSFPLGHWLDLYPLEHPYPWPSRLALFAASLIVVLYVAKWFLAKISHIINVFFIWANVAFGGVVLSFLISGISYIFLFPVLLFIAGLGVDFILQRGRDQKFGDFFWACHLGLLGGAYMAIYHYFIFDVVFNFQLSHFKLIPILILSIMAYPVVCQFLKTSPNAFSKVRNSLFGLLILGVLLAQFVPTYTLDRPRGMNLNHIENADQGTALWAMDVVGKPDPVYLEQAGFSLEHQDYNRYGLRTSKGFVREASFKEGMPPVLTVTSDSEENGMRILRGEFQSIRGGYTIIFGFKAGTKFNHLKINNQVALTFDEGSKRAQYSVPIHGLIKNSATFEISLPLGEEIEFQLIDFNFLTENQDAGSVLKFRPEDVKPIHGGDRSIIYKTFRF